LVELALVLPVLALIMVGALDLGRAFIAHQRLTNAVKEGALFGIHYPAQLTATSLAPLLIKAYPDPYNVAYQVRQEGAGEGGGADPALSLEIKASGDSDIVCYAGRSTTLLATGSFPGDCAKAKTGDTIRVRATYAFRPITPGLAGLIGTPLRLRATVHMVIQ
jgi:hypothetical protein